MNWTRERECVGQLRNPAITSCGSVIFTTHNAAATNMCVRRLLRLLLPSSLPAKSAMDLRMGRALGSPATIHMHEFHFSQYMTVCTIIPYLALLLNGLYKLCTAVVAGVHLHQPTHSLWETLNNIIGTVRINDVYTVRMLTLSFLLHMFSHTHLWRQYNIITENVIQL